MDHLPALHRSSPRASAPDRRAAAPWRWVVALALAVAPFAARAADERPRVDRPLGVDTPGTFRQLILDMPLADARPSGTSLEVRWTIANDWSVPTRLTRGGQVVDVQNDEQADRIELRGRIPWTRLGARGWLGERLDTTLAWSATQHWGGYTDGMIEAWHRFGGFNKFGRPRYPKDAVSIHLGVPGGPRLVDLDHSRFAVGDLVARTSLRVLEGERAAGPWAVALRLDLKAPIGRPGDAGGSGNPDAGLALSGSVPLLSWLTLHAQGAVRRVGPLSSDVPLRLRAWQYGMEVSLVAWRGDWSFALESRWVSALFEHGWKELSVPQQGDAVTALTYGQNQITGGLRWRAATLWFSEDWTPGNRREVGWRRFYNTNSPDIVIGLSWTQPL